MMFMNNPYQQLMNPYLQNNLYQPMQQPNIHGRMVQDFNEISANDVPMTGENAYFPKNNGNEISVRRWNNNGTISESLYAIVKPSVEPQVEECTTNELKDLYGVISERLDRIEKLITPAKRGKANESTGNTKSDAE